MSSSAPRSIETTVDAAKLITNVKRRRDYIEWARSQGESLPVVAQALKHGQYRHIWTI